MFYRFGSFRLDARQRLLYQGGELIPLTPKAFDTLLALVERSGDVVEKEDLLKKIWPDSFVEEGSLAQNVSILRRILGEGIDGQQYIQTIPKRGYRFVAQLDESPGASRAQELLASEESHESVQSIAILPFVNLSDDKEQEYFSDGLTEEIINGLSQLPGLKVTGSASSFAFRGKGQEKSSIADALHVSMILDGSVRRSGDRIRVVVHLIRAATGYQIWSQRYDRELADIFQIQDEIAAAITDALRIKLLPTPTVRRYQPNLRAYDTLLKAKYEAARLTPHSLARAKDLLEETIRLDPHYAEAHSELGQYHLMRALSFGPIGEGIAAAQEQAKMALKLSADNPLAHAILCCAAAWHYDWGEAERQFCMVLAPSPAPLEACARCAIAYLVPLGRFSEAFSLYERVLGQDPLRIATRSLYAVALLCAGLNDRALQEAARCIEIDQNRWQALSVITMATFEKGDLLQARQAAEDSVRLTPWRAAAHGVRAGIYGRLGEHDRSAELLNKLRSMAPSGLFWYHFLCSQIDQAAFYYAKMIESGDPSTTYLAAAKLLTPLRSSPHWPKLAKMMNLPAPRTKSLVLERAAEPD
jgi:TolB-like protein/Tfp pilus assembly protein PilF